MGFFFLFGAIESEQTEHIRYKLTLFKVLLVFELLRSRFNSNDQSNKLITIKTK